MKRTILTMIVFTLLTFSLATFASEAPEQFYNFSANDIDGNEVDLESFRGKVVLVVNVASKCGFTPQYEGLQKIYEQYRDKGFVVLGFPANNFANQEPGSNEEIKTFCQTNYGVTFPMFSKISVKGDDQHPLYQFLTSKEIHPELGGEITWNFNKFLISSDGRVINRFGSKVKPVDESLTAAIENALKS